VLRALLALIILGITGYFAVAKDPRLGLDLRGGTSITLETKDSPTTQADAESTDRALEVLRRRVDSLGVAEPTLARSGTNRIIVELPGVQDAASAEKAVGRTAQLTFHPVLGPGDPSQVVGIQPEPQQPAPGFSPGASIAPGASAPATRPGHGPVQGRRRAGPWRHDSRRARRAGGADHTGPAHCEARGEAVGRARGQCGRGSLPRAPAERPSCGTTRRTSTPASRTPSSTRAAGPSRSGRPP
jgi:SecD/SecF fusion protein